MLWLVYHGTEEYLYCGWFARILRSGLCFVLFSRRMRSGLSSACFISGLRSGFYCLVYCTEDRGVFAGGFIVDHYCLF